MTTFFTNGGLSGRALSNDATVAATNLHIRAGARRWRFVKLT